MKNKKVIVAMSGGVDSSVAAQLLVNQGFKVYGVFLHFWQEDYIPSKGRPAENKCCSTKALMDARRVSRQIGIPFYTLNFSQNFKDQVVDNFLKEYKEGRTPNPCARCNKLVKLGLLIKRARELGFDYVASGHYARLKKFNGRQRLYRASDPAKDQSYFLYSLTQEQLKYLIFPLANYKKEQVKKIAARFKLNVESKKESQEICFIAEKSHNDFLSRHLKLKPGPIRALPPNLPPARSSREGGAIKFISLKTKYFIPSSLSRNNRSGRGAGGGGRKLVGRHKGLSLYTIGQRRGVEIGGIGPFYVVKKDYKNNTLYVVKDGDDPALFKNEFIVKNINWISDREIKLPFSCQVAIRYGHKPVEGVISKIQASAGVKGKTKRYLIKLKLPQRAVTSGQSAVFYYQDEVLGGGLII